MASNQKSLGVCLLCIPLQGGVVMIALLNFVWAFFCFIQLLVHDVRFQSGGYNPRTYQFQVDVGMAGFIFGPFGFLGVYDHKVLWLKIFNAYQYFKLFVLFFVFTADLVALRKCEHWASSLEAQTMPNAPMYAISRKGLCDMARFYYIIGFWIDFGVNLYFAWVTRELCVKLAHCPAYAIKFTGGGGILGSDATNHTEVRFYDETLGEPVQHLGPTTFRPSDARFPGDGH